MANTNKKLGRTCSLWFCNRKHYANGFCHNHYITNRTWGSPIAPKNTDLINAVSAVANLKKTLQSIRADSNAANHHQQIDAVLGQTEGHTLNVIGRCNNCGMDKVARIEWPRIIVECGCTKQVFDIN